MIRALGEYILVTKVKREEESELGIIVPDDARDSAPRGKVEDVGKGVDDIKKGDVVILHRWGGEKSARIDEETILIKREEVAGKQT